MVAVNPPVFTVAHRPIPGYMQAMTMEFRAASPPELEAVRPGLRVRFVLRDKVARAFAWFRRTRRTCPSGAVQPRIGEPAPDFELIDQRGRPVTLGSFRGKLVALNFLYTRCPMPEVCPRLAASFAYVFTEDSPRSDACSRSRSTRSGTRLRYSPLMLNSGVPGMRLALSDRFARRGEASRYRLGTRLLAGGRRDCAHFPDRDDRP